MAFTQEAVAKNPSLVPEGGDRAWEVWDEPPAVFPDVVPAFRLMFVTSEQVVAPEQRTMKKWRNTIFIEAAPPGSGKLTVMTLFVTSGDIQLVHPTEPYFCLASLPLSEGRKGQLVAHAEPERGLPDRIDVIRAAIDEQSPLSRLEHPNAYLYLFGHHEDGARFVYGTRAYLEESDVQSNPADTTP